MIDQELLEHIDALRRTMISVATGRSMIDTVNAEYQSTFRLVTAELEARGIVNPIPFVDLWDWYGHWSSGEFPNYNSRRIYVAGLFTPLVELVNRFSRNETTEVEVTGWLRVDRGINEVKVRLTQAENEEQYQAVGLLCREVTISLAQEVFDPDSHTSDDGVSPSDTDARRMLEAYINYELSGRSAEAYRGYAKSTLRLALDLQHRRTAEFKNAAMVVEATSALVNVIAIASGRRDPA